MLFRYNYFNYDWYSDHHVASVTNPAQHLHLIKIIPLSAQVKPESGLLK
jgi:hypothetical protein